MVDVVGVNAFPSEQPVCDFNQLLFVQCLLDINDDRGNLEQFQGYHNSIALDEEKGLVIFLNLKQRHLNRHPQNEVTGKVAFQIVQGNLLAVCDWLVFHFGCVLRYKALKNNDAIKNIEESQQSGYSWRQCLLPKHTQVGIDVG